MKKLLVFVCVSISLLVNGQRKSPGKKLYYFLTKDSLLGVKTGSGKVVIKARRIYRYGDKDLKKPIKEELIYLDAPDDDIVEPHSCGVVYNRKGQFLFAPFFFDNGPDFFSEGMMRFVKNKKIGFADRNGSIVIEAKYDYANSFNYGIASYCNGCLWKNKGEHSFVTGGILGYISSKGDLLVASLKKENDKDQIVERDKFLPYQFYYTALEQKIIDSFYGLSLISKSYFVNHYSSLDTNERKLHFEIVERPSSFYPYYHIKAFEFSNCGGYNGNEILDLNFYVDTMGQQFFYLDYYNKKISLGKWLKESVKEASEFIKNHPDAPYKL